VDCAQHGLCGLLHGLDGCSGLGQPTARQCGSSDAIASGSTARAMPPSISPPAAVLEIAPAKVLQGAVRLQGLASSPWPDTHVRGAWALAGCMAKAKDVAARAIRRNLFLSIWPLPLVVRRDSVASALAHNGMLHRGFQPMRVPRRPRSRATRATSRDKTLPRHDRRCAHRLLVVGFVAGYPP
jgi:hypothetical protein